MIKKEVIRILQDRILPLRKEGKHLIYLVGPIRLPVDLDGKEFEFQWYSWLKCEEPVKTPDEVVEMLSSSRLAELQQSSVLVHGDFAESEEALIRFHSICHTGDIFGSKRCDCGFQLKQSMRMIIAKGSGALFYLANHEGRGIGLFSKALAYLLQENGYDTMDANLELGLEDDARNYEEAVRVLKSLREKPVTLITNNPDKLAALEAAGMNGQGHAPLWGAVSKHNEKYLKTKVEKFGHIAAD